MALEGRYANYFQIGHNAFEFLLDFGQFYPREQRESYHTRIILSPMYAKGLLKILQRSMADYEQVHGEIAQDD